MLIHTCTLTDATGAQTEKNVAAPADCSAATLAQTCARAFPRRDAETAAQTVFSSGEIELAWESGARLFVGLGLDATGDYMIRDPRDGSIVDTRATRQGAEDEIDWLETSPAHPFHAAGVRLEVVESQACKDARAAAEAADIDSFEARYDAWEAWCAEYDLENPPCAEEVSAALAIAISRGRRELPAYLAHIENLGAAFDALESVLDI